MVLPSGLLVPTSPRLSLVVYIMEWSRTFLCFKEASNWLNSGIKNILLASLGLVRFLFNFFLWEVFTTYGKYVAYVKESLPSAGIRFNISIAIYLMIKSLYLNLLMSGTNPEIFNYHRCRPWCLIIWWSGIILAFGLIFYIVISLTFQVQPMGMESSDLSLHSLLLCSFLVLQPICNFVQVWGNIFGHSWLRFGF